MRRATASRFSLIFVLLLAVAAWTFSISAAQQRAEQSAEQTTAQLPAASPGEMEQAQSAPEAVETRQEETTAHKPAEALPANSEQALQVEAGQGAQLAVPSQPDSTGMSYPPEYVPLIQKTAASLMAANFTFVPVKALDPFVPFVTLDTSTRSSEEEDEQQGGEPLTPLQKMTLSEIERGLKAISWGELGKRAVIEDSTGKGYIVTVGTPAGEHSGVITQILNDSVVIQQEIWDRKAKKRSPQDFTIKLVKKTDNK
jgi:type IV pilus assembly protein PilP